jgi:DNA-directed RNA polymerase subunit N (RpoN/RPB10)
MIIPVRCYSCGKCVGHLYGEYKKRLDRDYTEAEALDELGLERYCCRRMILSHIDLVDDLIPYSVPVVGTMQALTTRSATPASVQTPMATPSRTQ